MRFQQLFGDTDRFAIRVAIRDDPSPPPDAPRHLVRSWGDLELWVNGVCLTQSPWTDGPTVARAKAFGAMLLMPAEQCRSIAEQGHSGAELVQAVMQEFGTPRMATAWHLNNLRLLDEDDVGAIHFG